MASLCLCLCLIPPTLRHRCIRSASPGGPSPAPLPPIRCFDADASHTLPPLLHPSFSGVSAPMHQSRRVSLSCPSVLFGTWSPMHQSRGYFPPSFTPSRLMSRRRCISPIGYFSTSFTPSRLVSRRRCIRYFSPSFPPASCLVSRRRCIRPVGYFPPSFTPSCLVSRRQCISPVGYVSPSFPPSCPLFGADASGTFPHVLHSFLSSVSAPMHQAPSIISFTPSSLLCQSGADASAPGYPQGIPLLHPRI
jgi:hypothetical protein